MCCSGCVRFYRDLSRASRVAAAAARPVVYSIGSPGIFFVFEKICTRIWLLGAHKNAGRAQALARRGGRRSGSPCSPRGMFYGRRWRRRFACFVVGIIFPS